MPYCRGTGHQRKWGAVLVEEHMILSWLEYEGSTNSDIVTVSLTMIEDLCIGYRTQIAQGSNQGQLC
jgi:hypothetical protein